MFFSYYKLHYHLCHLSITMNGRDHVRSTMRRGFRAYFNACMPSATSSAMVEVVVAETPRRFPRRLRCQSPLPEPKETKGFIAQTCEGDGLEDCAICFDSITTGQKILTLRCSDTMMHCFHEECISPWLKDKGTCPVCRADIL